MCRRAARGITNNNGAQKETQESLVWLIHVVLHLPTIDDTTSIMSTGEEELMYF